MLDRVESISSQKVLLYNYGTAKQQWLRKALFEHEIETVIYFAGLKIKWDPVQQPLRRFNLIGAPENGRIGEDPYGIAQ